MRNFLIFLFISLILFTSCNRKKHESGNSQTDTRQNLPPEEKGTIETERYAFDEGRFIEMIGVEGTHLFSLTLYEGDSTAPRKIQVIDSLPTQWPLPFDVKVTDFNKDGLSDLLVSYGTGARGANEFMYLLLQNPEDFQLTYIKTPGSVTNLTYDSSRQVVTATSYTASAYFRDFILQQDSLKLIGGTEVRVDSVWTIHRHFTINEAGEEVTIKEDSLQDEGESAFSRYE